MTKNKSDLHSDLSKLPVSDDPDVEKYREDSLRVAHELFYCKESVQMILRGKTMNDITRGLIYGRQRM